MTRKRIIRLTLIILGSLVIVGGLLFNFNSVRIVAPMKSALVAIYRNHRAVPANQIRSVKYRFSGTYIVPDEEVRENTLRDASLYGDGPYYHIGAAFSIITEGEFLHRTRIEPPYRSVFLRVTFTDGKTVSFSYPLEPISHDGGAIYIDLGDAPP